MSLTSPAGLSGADLARWLAEHVFPLVQKPGRYCGGELGAIPWTGCAELGTVLLGFPDVYEIGAGHVGLSLLQASVNAVPDMRAERAYSPWPDMEELMRHHGVPLYSLESFLPARCFDVFGITIQHELSFSNILTLIDLAGIPVLQADRAPNDPYVIGGGPGTCNPEPMADFFDLFVIGDGEGVLPELAKSLAQGRRRHVPRCEVLRTVASRQGVYVPSLWGQGARSDSPTAPMSERRTPISIDPVRVPSLVHDSAVVQTVPLIAPAHDRVTIEIMRGCPRRCRFCQARLFYGPVRFRSPEEVVNHVGSAVDGTGVDEVSLLSLSTGDYPHLAVLLATLNDHVASRRVGISLPSLRAESFTPDICAELRRTHQRGLTLAPEAGTEHLRAAIGKDLADADLLRAVDLAFASGWTNVKLYFMVGLPGETEDDIDGIGTLVRQVVAIARRHGGRRVGVACSPFVPKPHTEFERAPFLEPCELERRQRRVRSLMPRKIVDYAWRDPHVSFWEAVFARGDRKLGPMILTAWRLGARFDEWESSFRQACWADAATHCSIDPSRYAARRESTEVLPWSHINIAARSTVTGRTLRSPARVPAACPPPRLPTSSLHRVRVAYTKLGLRRFLSHLDMVRLWHLILRRAGMELCYTGGFSPRPRLAFGPALPLGIGSEQEFMEFWAGDVDTATCSSRINSQCPPGIAVLAIREVPHGAPSLDAEIVLADYAIQCPPPGQARIDEAACLPGVERIWVERDSARFSVRLKTRGAVKPRHMVGTLCGVGEQHVLLTALTRTGLWAERHGVRVSPLEVP